MIKQSPSCLTPDRETRSRDFCTLLPFLRNSSSRSRALGKFCAGRPRVSVVSRRCAGGLTGRSPIPSFGILQIRRGANAHLGEITHGVFGLGEARDGGFARPEVGFGIALLEHALGPGEIPAAEGQFALMFLLHRRPTVPGDALSGIDRTPHQPILVGASESILREFISQIGRLAEELERIGFVFDDAVTTGGLLV